MKMGAAKALALSEKVEKEKEKQKLAAEAELSGFFSDLADSGSSGSIFIQKKILYYICIIQPSLEH